MGENRRARLPLQHGFGEDRQKLVAPDHAAFTVDRADAVAVAVKGDSAIQIVFGHSPAQVRKVALLGRVGVVAGKVAVHLGESSEERRVGTARVRKGGSRGYTT